jgi:hypothetical protein
MALTKAHGAPVADPQAQARAASALALAGVVSATRELQERLGDLEAAHRSMLGTGAYPIGYPAGLARAVTATFRMWERTNEGREALGLGLLPTRSEVALENARIELQVREEQLEAARAIVPLTGSMVKDRQGRIEDAALAVIRVRRRIAELEDGPVDSFRAWLTGFARDIRQVLNNPPAIPRAIGDTTRMLDERDAAEARRDDPLGFLIADELGKD